MNVVSGFRGHHMNGTGPCEGAGTGRFAMFDLFGRQAGAGGAAVGRLPEFLPRGWLMIHPRCFRREGHRAGRIERRRTAPYRDRQWTLTTHMEAAIMAQEGIAGERFAYDWEKLLIGSHGAVTQTEVWTDDIGRRSTAFENAAPSLTDTL